MDFCNFSSKLMIILDYSGILVVSGDGLVHEVFNGMALVKESSYV